MKVDKLMNSWSHFGTRMMISKAWEKFLIDSYRFRLNCQRSIPVFENLGCTKIEKSTALLSQNKITICYLVHYFFPDKQGGTERFVLNQAKEQQNRGNRVNIITLGKRPENQYFHHEGNILWTEFIYEGIPVTQIRYKRAPRGLYYDAILPNDFQMILYAKMAIERYKPDIVHMAYPQPFAAFAKVCMKKKIPYVITLTDFNIFCHYATMVSKSGEFCTGSKQGKRCNQLCKTYGVKDAEQRYLYAKKLLGEASQVTVPSNFVANVVGAEFHNRSIVVIPHGICREFSPNRKRCKTKVFLYAGTLSCFKGVHFLIRTFQKLQGEVFLKVCGSGESNYTKKLYRLASKDPRISFCGSISQEKMANLYHQVDCIVVPSIWFETYNFVLREALACGCIGVVSNLGAMPEAIEEGKNGFLFTAGNEEELLRALEKAQQFDWSNYKQNVFPNINEECSQYQRIYQKALI